jgi:hypothetical protein
LGPGGTCALSGSISQIVAKVSRAVATSRTNADVLGPVGQETLALLGTVCRTIDQRTAQLLPSVGCGKLLSACRDLRLLAIPERFLDINSMLFKSEASAQASAFH